MFYCRTAFAALLLMCCASLANSQVNVTTYHYDNSRSGQNTQELILTPSNVNVNQFGKLFTVAVDGYVYAQPLYVAGVQIARGSHNVLYIATEHDSVYAIDADTGTVYVHLSLIPSGGRTVNPETDIGQGCDDIVPEIGITGTPVIDTTSGTLYVVAKSVVSGQVVQYLHALDIQTFAEKFGSPINIQASVSGTGSDSKNGIISFSPKQENQRPALLLENGHVIITFASHCDFDPWHGWVLSYNSNSLSQEAVLNTTPKGKNGAIWMSGAGPIADSSWNIYFAIGNGDWNGTTDFGDSIVKLGPPSAGTFPVLDYFTPWDQMALDSGDIDLGAGGAVLLPSLPSGQQFLALIGKNGTMFEVDRNNLGKYCPNLTPACTNSDPQIFFESPHATTGTWGAPAYWNGNLYWGGSNDHLKAFSFNISTGAISKSTTSVSTNTFQYPTPTPSVSANGNADGIVWSLDDSAYGSACSAGANCQVLYAYSATNLGTMLYNSNQASAQRDVPGAAVKFTTPMVANGKVYVGSQYAVSAFGELSSVTPTAATPTFSLTAGAYTGTQTVNLSDATSGAVIYYTTNGTQPTTASTQYTGPLKVSATTTIEAIAVATGYGNSAVASATYTIVPPTAATPTFSLAPGSYTGTQTVGLSDTTSGAVIYYTTNGTQPTTASTLYTRPLTVSATTTIEAIAVATGYSNSTVASATYTIGSSQTPTPVSVNLTAVDDRYGIAVSGATITGGGLDAHGGTYASNLLGSSLTWNGSTFTFAATGANSAVTNATITLPPGSYSVLNLLGTGVNGNQPNQSFVVTYTDGTKTTFTQSLSDWFTPQSYSGETSVVSMAYRYVKGVQNAGPVRLYGYSFALNSSKTVVSLTLPANTNVAVLAIDLTPAGVAAAATPTFSLAGGTYTGTQTVSLSDATAGASIYYTTNGSAATTASTKYTIPLTVNATTTIEAIAAATGYSNSAVASVTYTIKATSTPVSVSLSGVDDRYGIASSGATISGGGLDGYAGTYASNLLGSGASWNGSSFIFASAGPNSAVTNATVPLPSGNYSVLNVLGTGLNGNHPNQSFVVAYSDGTKTTYTQSLSDWFSPQGYSGESIVSTMAYRYVRGLQNAGPVYLYGYSFALNSTKTVASVTLPAGTNIGVLAISLR